MNMRHETPYGKFEWDSEKEGINCHKHGISFTDAAMVFQDEWRVMLYDEAHSESEDRYILIGKMKAFLIVVVFTERDTVYRIISARLATKKEVKIYEREAYRH